MKSTTSAKIIKTITPMSPRFGVPFSLRTDNGPQFVSEEFESFLLACEVEHPRTTPMWPQANGEVDRQNRSLLKSLQIANLEGKKSANRVGYLAGGEPIHSASNDGCNALLPDVWSEMRTKLPELRRETVEVPREEVRDHD